MLIVIATLIAFGMSRAQAQGMLVGPLIAADTASTDRILLYDLGGNGNEPRVLNFGAGAHRVWGFAPDGCRILLSLSEGFEQQRLYTARIDGTDLRELVTFTELPPDQWSAWDARWSPDGTRVAFTLIRDQAPSPGAEIERTYHIAWVGAEGGVPQFYSVTGDEHEPRWSPDGRWLAYIAFEERVPGADMSSTAVPTDAAATPTTLIREADLWVTSADGASKYRLTAFDTGSVRAPSWSPDSLLVGFTYSPSPSNEQFWMIANQPNAISTQLSAEWSLILDTTWLPDSTAMVSAVRDFQGTRENKLWRIPLVGLADTDATVYLNDPLVGYADYPRFSADGRRLVLRSAYALVVVDTTTMGWTLLDTETMANTPPVWSPAGFVGEGACG
jgi:Tol biopolymer transport system component